MFRKLRKVDSAAKVINYIEGDDEVLTHHAKKRVQKMMHYRYDNDASLKIKFSILDYSNCCD